VVEPWAKGLEAKVGGRVEFDLRRTSPVGGVTDRASNVKPVDNALALRGRLRNSSAAQ
jgi:hypothetical protein